MSADPKISDFFVAGGTLRPDAPSYVKRPADDELFNLTQAGTFCYILTARQMGKSSLMTRTERRLREVRVSTATIDLTSIGTVTIDAWYLGLLTELTRQLRLATDPKAWWQERATLGQPQRFTNFLRDIVLAEIKGQVVIFIDEIDSTLNLDFADDFFAAIRFTYNARAADAAYARLTFVLLGVATPSDLIKDATRTPFNIGQAIDLREFTWADAQPLRQGLTNLYPEQGETSLQRIFYWTNGHPYLTQKLCASVVKTGDGSWSETRVDEEVERLFLSEEARNEDNLKFVQRNVERIESGQRRRLLGLYRRVYEKKKVKENQQSLDQNRLKLFALVGAKNGVLQVRNEIYRRAFNRDWIKANTPVDWNRRIAIISVVIALTLGVYIWQQSQQTNEVLAQAFTTNFNSTTNPAQRLGALNNLFGLPGYDDEARALFDTLSPDDKITLFTNATPDLQPQMRIVVKGVYTHLGDTEDNNRLLQAMQAALKQSEEADSKILAIEIGHWLAGRAALAAENYEEAKQAYDNAIETNDANPATHFERALVLAAIEDYKNALTDLETVLGLNEDWREQVQQTVKGNNQLYTTLWRESGNYPTLVRVVSTPTSTSTPTDTATPQEISASTPIPTHTPSPIDTPTSITTSISLPLPLSPPPSPVIDTPTSIATSTPALKGKIAYTLNNGIYLMNADGSNKHIYKDEIQDLSLSPDGSQIAFVRQGEIWVIDAEGNNMRQIIYDSQITSVDIRPDKEYIAYSQAGTIYMKRIVDSGGGQFVVEPIGMGAGTRPDWSPDNYHLAAETQEGIGRMTWDRHDNSVIITGGDASWPDWSPDGSKIAFVRGNDIYVQDSSGIHQLTDNPANDWQPAWSPDGSKIAFISNRDGNQEIYIINADGTGQMNLTNSPENENLPVWSR